MQNEMGKKSLAEQIEELSRPKKDFDIESNDFTANAVATRRVPTLKGWMTMSLEPTTM